MAGMMIEGQIRVTAGTQALANTVRGMRSMGMSLSQPFTTQHTRGRKQKRQPSIACSIHDNPLSTFSVNPD
jgi:hypothetical protein